MTTSSLPLLSLLLLLSPTPSLAECDYVTLVKCFIEVLDEWAWTLYETKDNVVAVSDQGCTHFNTIRRCILDKNEQTHGCEQSEVLEASRTVSDLLTHRKHAGTFLKSYYLLEYACTDGKAKVMEHKECLQNQMIGEQTLSAAGYLEEKFKETKPESPEAACSLFTEKLLKFKSIIAQQDLCNGEAEQLMCESLKRMFINVEPAQLGNCAFDCFEADGVATEPPIIEVTNTIAGANGLEQKPTGSAAALAHSTLLLLLTALLHRP